MLLNSFRECIGETLLLCECIANLLCIYLWEYVTIATGLTGTTSRRSYTYLDTNAAEMRSSHLLAGCLNRPLKESPVYLFPVRQILWDNDVETSLLWVCLTLWSSVTILKTNASYLLLPEPILWDATCLLIFNRVRWHLQRVGRFKTCSAKRGWFYRVWWNDTIMCYSVK